jgi:hypothetical protein
MTIRTSANTEDHKFVMSKIAKPGDPDLDLDIDGVTVTAVVVVGHELMVRTTGGWGTWISTDGTRFTAEPADPDSCVVEGQFNVAYPQYPKSAAEQAVHLEAWRDTATPLRICGAPGKLTTIIENNDRWIMLPRSDPDR